MAGRTHPTLSACTVVTATSSAGRIITVVTTTPMFFIAAGAVDAAPKGGHVRRK